MWARPAAGQRDVRRGVVGRAERRRGDESAARRQQSRHRVDGGHLEGFLRGQRGEDARQPARQHALARPRRPDEEQVVAPGGGDLQGAAGQRLSPHVGQVGRRRVRGRRPRNLHDPSRSPSGQHGDGLVERGHRQDGETGDDRRLARVGVRQHQAVDAVPARLRRDGEDAAHRPHRAVERELADGDHPLQPLAGNETGRREHADGDRQVERRPHLAHVRRREVDRYPPRRKLEAGVADGALDAVAALADARVGQADEGDRRQPAVRYVDLDPDGMRLDAEQGRGPHDGQHDEMSCKTIAGDTDAPRP